MSGVSWAACLPAGGAVSLPSCLPGLEPPCTWVLALLGWKEGSSVELPAPGSPWEREFPGAAAASVRPQGELLLPPLSAGDSPKPAGQGQSVHL